METLWFWLVSVMVAIYAVMDGFDFGAGIHHLTAAKTNEERRTILAAIGPLWDGNEVWLLAGGGAMFLAFPRVLAAADVNELHFGPDYVIPKPMDPRLLPRVARAVAVAAVESGVARIPLPDRYMQE